MTLRRILTSANLLHIAKTLIYQPNRQLNSFSAGDLFYFSLKSSLACFVLQVFLLSSIPIRKNLPDVLVSSFGIRILVRSYFAAHIYVPDFSQQISGLRLSKLRWP